MFFEQNVGLTYLTDLFEKAAGYGHPEPNSYKEPEPTEAHYAFEYGVHDE